LSAFDHTNTPGSRSAALLLLGHTCDATVSELVALDIADLAGTNDGLLVKVHRQSREGHDVVCLSPRGADPATCAVAAAQKLLAGLRAAGRTEGPLFVRTDADGWVPESAPQNGRPIYDPNGRLSAGAAANIVVRIGRAAGINFDCDWTRHSLRRCFTTATATADRQ
jgi:hypothetical protein